MRAYSKKTIIAAAEILLEFEDSSPPMDRLLHHYYKERRWLGGGDRRAIGEVVYGVMRQHALLDWLLGQVGIAQEMGHRLGLWLLLQSNARAASGDDSGPTLDLAWYLEKLHDAPLGDLLEKFAAAAAITDTPPDWVQGNCPEWLVPRLQQAFGDNLAAELSALNQEAGVDLRVNIRRGSRSDWLNQFLTTGWEAEATPLSPIGIRLPLRFNFNDLPAIREGLLEVQEEAAQLAAVLVGAEPGMRVLDLCAGAGGKALALADFMEGKGQLLLTDISEAKLNRAGQRLARADAQNAQKRLLTGITDPWLKRQAGKFDRVLVDAPCSNLGTWRRNPDARWRLNEADITDLVERQRQLLTVAATLVKPGGRLIYATCSLLPEENQEQAAWFTQEMAALGYQPLTLTDWLANTAQLTAEVRREILKGQDETAGIQLTPARHGTDGFYVMAWSRDEAAAAAADVDAAADDELDDEVQVEVVD
ncbi:MAG: RsmB/NOP family class I SAM-dependent RNA methyltransferase [Alphaproteobacteria bacterium]|nr:RsmB/NOP family class I SAM-dependent RNA methyltransferase [Alphaproteobacteria bacterium]